MANYFCHECNRRVTVNNALQCENCRGNLWKRSGGMFIVQRDGDDQGRTISFGRLFGHILNQPSRDRSASTSQRPDTPHVDHEGEPSTAHRNTRSSAQANPMAENGGNQPAHLTFRFDNGGGDGSEGAPIFQTLHGNLNDYAWGEGGIDHIVTQLLNQFEGGREESIRAEDLSRIPMTEVTAKQVENGTQCATCMDTFALNEKVAKLDCQHIFHQPCIEPWLKKRNTCPICRQVVDPKNWSAKPSINDLDELD
uniref:RING-type domain-containing protein n=1 Tax=Ditylenchus dipsaci TaxID=166011 RepID=A0A915DNU6_9BILA